ncbi:MAG: DegT/DnrJ/EryC1/StrS family aminotransferase [Gammaproteobacteria bacterium]
MTITDSMQFIDLRAQQKRLQRQIDQALKRVLAHGNYILGPEVGELEQALAEFSAAKHVVTCASGTDALLMALMALGVKPGDAVFMPSFTFVATAEVVALLGATPVFVDINEDVYLISMASLRAAIDAAKKLKLRPRVVVPVDLFGQPADYDEVRRIAEEYDLYVIADAAQSFGGARAGRRVGTLAPITATSFFPAKPLGCYGDGGALFTDDTGIAAVFRSLRVHGQGQDKYDNVRIGVNGRLDTLQAAILIEKLRIFAEEIEARQRVAGRYNEALSNMVVTPKVAGDAVSAWAQYTIRTEQRDQLAERLKKRSVPTAVYYPKPLHCQPAYSNYPTSPGGLPISAKLAAEVLSLPMHPYLDTDTQDYIIACVREAL